MGGTSNQDGPTRGGWASAYYFDSLGNIPCAGGNLVGNGDNASPAGIDGFAEILVDGDSQPFSIESGNALDGGDAGTADRSKGISPVRARQPGQ